MITVEEAINHIMSSCRDFGTEQVNLTTANNRILREALVADRDFPPFDRVTMDGIGIVTDMFNQGQRDFTIAGIAAAGADQQSLQNPEHCLEVMTGAILPDGVDAVVRYEDVEIIDQRAKIAVEAVKFRQNIHRQGSDRPLGDLLLAEGVKMSAAEAGVAATVGKDKLLVSRLPKTVVISTGDELVDISATPLRHQIRRSNSISVRASLESFGLVADLCHINDSWEEILKALEQILSDYDLIILSGGVSKGKYDFLPEAFEKLGVKKHFHKVLQRPGKPFWFGTKDEHTAIFALPGNPVSTFMCTHRYVVPWLRQSLRMKKPADVFAVLSESVFFKPDLTYYVQVKLSHDEQGRLQAKPMRGNGSGDLASLVDADGFMELPRGKDTFQAGEVFRVFLYR